MTAVLEDALKCFWMQFTSKRPRDLRLAKEAEEWFLNERDASAFSFTNVCTMLRIDPAYIRAGLLRLRQIAPIRASLGISRKGRIRSPLRLSS
jgi:hypothetical protein